LLGGGLASNDVEGWLAASPDLASHPVASMAPHDASDHDTSDIVCFTIRRERALPALALTLLLEALADHYGPGLLRLKGLIRIAELPDRPAVVHGVQHVFHEPRWLDKWPSADISTRLVLIGRGLSSLWVESLLDALEAEIIEASGIADR
jgi:G3E family GTPase